MSSTTSDRLSRSNKRSQLLQLTAAQRTHLQADIGSLNAAVLSNIFAAYYNQPAISVVVCQLPTVVSSNGNNGAQLLTSSTSFGAFTALISIQNRVDTL